jgi:hypothetical protein
MLVTARELNNMIDRKKKEKHATFNTLLEQCVAKIKKYAGQQQYRCLYEIPEFILGSPPYQLNDALEYLMDKLKNQCGLFIRYFFPKLLYISWDYTEIAQMHAMTTIPNVKPLPAQNMHGTRGQIAFKHMPDTMLPRPAASNPRRKPRAPGQPAQQFKSISEYKPSGKFVLNLS